MRNIIIACLLSVSLLSCDDFLTLEPENQMNELGFYKTQSDFETALVGLYSGLQNYGKNLIWINELGTDNAVFQLSNAENTVTAFEYMDLTPTNGYVGSYWSNAYGMISRANSILNKIDKVDFDESAKNAIKGECKFIRALSYFQLVRLFGPVSITEIEFTSPNQIAGYDFSRKPVKQVYEFILADLTDAEMMLPSTIPSNKGKVSVGAVKALMGKVYLTLHDYEKASRKLKEVIDLNAYSLVDDYAALFSEGNDDTSESILEIEYASGNLGEGQNFAFHYYPNVMNMAVFPSNLLGGGRCVPGESLFNTFEEGDLRKETMFGDQLPMVDGTTTHYLFCRKFADYKATTLDDAGVNFTLMRYADVFLMYAEALNEQGQTTAAIEYLNAVRIRAGLKGLIGLSQSELRLALEKERRYELAFEGHRWFDLVRTNRATTVLNADYAARGLAFRVEDYELLLPIPQGELDINPDLGQNDGY